MSISERISKLLKEKKRTQKDFSEYLGIRPSTLNTWLKNGTDIPAKYVMPSCRYFSVTPVNLLEGDDSEIAESKPIPDGYVQLDDDERYLIETLRNLDRDGRHLVIGKAIEEKRRISTTGEQGTDATDRVG